MSLLLTVKYDDKYLFNQLEETGTQISITYGDKSVITLSGNQTVILNTKDKVLDDFVDINGHLLNTKEKMLEDYIQVISERMPWDTNPKTEAELNLEYTWVVN